MKTHLVIPGRLPGLNEYTKDCRGNRYQGNKAKKDAEKIIKAAIDQQLPGVSFQNPVHVDFRWYEANKKRDLDNIAFAKKFIFDALVDRKVLQCDSWKGVIGYKDYFLIDKDNPRVEVVIYRV